MGEKSEFYPEERFYIFISFFFIPKTYVTSLILVYIHTYTHLLLCFEVKVQL